MITKDQVKTAINTVTVDGLFEYNENSYKEIANLLNQPTTLDSDVERYLEYLLKLSKRDYRNRHLSNGDQTLIFGAYETLKNSQISTGYLVEQSTLESFYNQECTKNAKLQSTLDKVREYFELINKYTPMERIKNGKWLIESNLNDELQQLLKEETV